MQLRVFGEVHHAHAPAADLTQQPELTGHGTSKRRGRFRPREGVGVHGSMGVGTVEATLRDITKIATVRYGRATDFAD
jgi:hypothetical protein